MFYRALFVCLQSVAEVTRNYQDWVVCEDRGAETELKQGDKSYLEVNCSHTFILLFYQVIYAIYILLFTFNFFFHSNESDTIYMYPLFVVPNEK